MSVLAIVQARFGSTRLPGKILETIAGQTLLEIHLRRLQKSKLINKLIVATTHEREASEIIAIAKNLGIESFSGSMDDVLDRYYQAALAFGAGKKFQTIVRICSDCPLVDAALIDQSIEKFLVASVDYTSLALEPSYPLGMDHEVFTFASLERAWKEAKLNSEREHVTPYIWKNSDKKDGALFKALALKQNKNQSALRMVVDLPEDLQVIKAVISALGTEASWQEYASFLEAHPEISSLNNFVARDAGYQKSLKDEK